MERTDRRGFIRRVGLAATAVVACTAADEERLRALAEEPAPGGLSPSDLKWGKAPCRFCGTGCGVEVGVKDGRVMAVRGDERSPVNRGLLCVKGYSLPAILYGRDRLLYPLRRKGDGTYERISWDAALDLVASRFSAALKDHGPAAVSVYGSGQWTVFDGYAASKWVKGGMKSNEIEPNARLCMASAVMGYMTQFQSDEPMGCYDDFELAHDIVLWGHNAAEMHPVLFSRMLEHRRKNPGVRIIDLTTRRSPTSDHADMVVEFRPGSDLALANGILHLLVKDGRVDHAFLKENVIFKRGVEDAAKIGYGCFGEQAGKYVFQDEPRDSSYEDLVEFLREYTPEKVSAISGVPVRQIELLAGIYGNPDRGVVSTWCMGVNQHYRGTWMNNLITDIHILTGKICRPGSNPFSITGQPSACGTAREVGTFSHRLPADRVVTNPEHRKEAEDIWGLPAGTINPKPGRHAADMFRAWDRGEVKAIWIQTTNPWVTMPNLNRIAAKRHGADQFLVVSDVYPTPTTDRADLILPAALWVEREGVFGNTERRTQQWDRLVDPPGEAREDAWATIQVAVRMGYGSLFPWFDPKDPAKDWHAPLFEEYRRFGLGSGKDLAAYEQLRATHGGLRWPVVEGKETRWRYTAGHDPYVKKARGAHFYKAKGYGEKCAFWIRPYHPPPEAPDAEFPFWLCTGRVLEHWHTGSLTRRVRQLHQAVPGAYVEMHAVDAAALGVRGGDRVRLVSRRGRLELPLVVDGRGRPPKGSVFVPFFDESILVNVLTLDSMCNISKQPDYKKCAVRVERA